MIDWWLQSCRIWEEGGKEKKKSQLKKKGRDYRRKGRKLAAGGLNE